MTAWAYRRGVHFAVLGPLRVEGAGGPVDIRGAKERTLLAHLLASGGRMVPVPDLVDSLWGEDPPASATKSLQTFVLRLRNALEPDRAGAPALLLTEGAGYRLAIEPDQLDAHRFGHLVALGRRSLAEGRPGAAVDTLAEAASLWRGPAYAGFEHTRWGQAEARRLDELRIAAEEDRLRAELDLGRAAGVVAELRRLVGDHPLRESAWELLVLALYRDGRQGEALGAYEEARRELAEELGVDPGPALRELHARVLDQDPMLGAPRLSVEVPSGLTVRGGPLVGRDGELAVLRQRWERAVAGEPGALTVRGPSGAGATRLVAALAEEVAHSGGRVVLVDRTGSHGADVAGVPSLVVADHAESSRPATLTITLAGRDARTAAGGEVLDLAPLERGAVRAILGEYLGTAAADEATDDVLSASGGWPGRVHELAVARARDLAARRVEVAARATGASAASLAAARHDLADGVLALREAAEPTVQIDADSCPWRGLEAYDIEDAPWFAGRERLVAELLARCAGRRLVALVGASGSGKSSALRAGLLAALRDDVLPGSGAWRQVVLRPGRHPMQELSRAALGHGRASVGDLLATLVRADGVDAEPRVVVAVDQLEELWTACDDVGERAAFLDSLAGLATDPGSGVTVVVAIRADYVGELAEHAALAAALADATVLVGSPGPAEVRRAVERPASRAGLVLDDGLADAIVADSGAEPGLLPLLSTAMTRLWDARRGRSLTFGAYVGMGGLAGSIASLADAAYAALPEERRPVARAVLLRLSGPGEGAGVTRRRVPLTELRSLPLTGTDEVVTALADARFLTVSDGAVEVAHEALFREWPLLRGWLVEDTAGRAVQRRLAVAAAEWDAEGRDGSALWTGTRLAAAAEAAQARPEEVTPTEWAFIDAGRDALDAARREAEERARSKARQNRRLRLLLAGVAAFLVLALVAGLLAWRSRQQATAAETAADARRLAASALNIEEPDRALLAAIEATKVEQGPETYGALLTLLARQPRVVHRMRIPDRFLREAVTPDGRTVLLSMNSPRLRAVDALTARVLWDVETPTGGQVQNIVVTADGAGAIVALNGGEGEGGVARLDIVTGRPVWTVRDADIGSRVGAGYVDGPSQGGLTRDGRYLLSTDAHVVELDPASGRVVRATPWPRQMAYSTETLVWPDGRVSQDLPNEPKAVQVFDPARPSSGMRPLAGVALAASPDGSRVLVGKEAGTGSLLRIVDSSTFEDVTREIRTAYYVGEARWSRDGTRLVWCTDDGFQVVDPRTLELGAQGSGHSGAVMDTWFAGPDEDLVWTAGRDSTAVAFDLSGARTPIASSPADPRPSFGKQSVTGGLGVYVRWEQQALNTAHLTDLRTGRDRGELPPASFKGRIVQPLSVAVTPDGATAVVGHAVHTEDFRVVDGRVELWDTGHVRRRSSVDLPWDVLGVAVTPDGRRAVLNGGEGFAVMDLDAGRLVVQPKPLAAMDPADGTPGAEVSPDGRWAALARNGEVVLVDLATAEVVRRRALTTGDRAVVQALAWTADSRRLAAGTSEGFLHVVDATTLADVAPRRQIAVWVIDLELSRDGRLMASAGSDGDITLWDTRTWQPYGQPITDDRLWAWLTFTEDGRRLRAFFEEKEMVDIDITPQAWVAAGCKAAGRNLTIDEAAVIVPGRPRTPTCPRPG